MKISEEWLREWINPPISTESIAQKLTMSGLEVEDIAKLAEPFSNVVVAEIIHSEKHPEATRLKVCQVDIGKDELLTIVCGAPNVVSGMKVPLALEGAILPNNVKITRSKIRNVYSNGMLCSASELGLPHESDGLLALPQDAPKGQDVWEYLNLKDCTIEISITPNRGDCLSVMGIAKEVSALTEVPIKPHDFEKIMPTLIEKRSISIDSPKACPHYVGRVIRNVKADAITPVWMQERLRRSGTRCISPIVDVMNYVMLELGTPMHAFDLQTIQDNVYVRFAKPGEAVTLLDGKRVQLDSKTLVIADDQKVLAMAGVMGGMDSGVTLLTKDIFLESAYFAPTTIARTARQYKLSSESSYRYERSVDSTLQAHAMERATSLLLSIVGGEVGPIIEEVNHDYLPSPAIISLRSDRIAKILGITISDNEIESILLRLGFSSKKTEEGWRVTIPVRRSDVVLEIDLIEEVMRLHGYQKLPEHLSSATFKVLPQSKVNLKEIRQALCHFGFNEIITYSFVDKKMQQLLDPKHFPLELDNPISAEMSVMRTNLWPGLINTLLYNQNRQQMYLRLFETGLRFVPHNKAYLEEHVLSGLISNSVYPEQWGVSARDVDFFDLKGDLENLFQAMGVRDAIKVKVGDHPALHPGQTAAFFRDDQCVGVIGALHPGILQQLKISTPIFVFEILSEALAKKVPFHLVEVSKFPEIRRDIAILVDQSIPIQVISDTIYEVGGSLLRNVVLFDVYQGKGIAPNRKSIALALTLQHSSRTLVDEEVADVLNQVIAELKSRFAAELRG